MANAIRSIRPYGYLILDNETDAHYVPEAYSSRADQLGVVPLHTLNNACMYVLQTDRLSLRQLSTQDAPFILDLLNTPGWLAFIGDRDVKTLHDARTYILTGPVTSYTRHGFGLYVVELKDNRLPIGLCGLLKRETLEDVDIGFAFLPLYTGQGYAYEAASAVLTYARTTLHLNRVVAISAPGNQRSINLLERLGMHYKATITLAGNTGKSVLYETS